MSIVYIMNTSKIKGSDMELFMNYLDTNRKRKINELHQQVDKNNSFGLGMLTLWVLKKYGYSKEALHYTAANKPYVNQGFQLSLSHSGQYACVAISTRPIGVDIQEHRGYSSMIMQRHFNREEQRLVYVNQANFYQLWCYKEAYIKLFGYSELKDIPNIIHGFCHYELNFDDFYSGCVISQDDENWLERVAFESVLKETTHNQTNFP